MSDIRYYGIRHHGPGSAKTLIQELTLFQPDMILVEGPADAEGLLPLLLDVDMRPPLALLIYQHDDLTQSAIFPFAEFSPEYQAIHFGLKQHIPVQFMDIPQSVMLPLRKASQLEYTPIDTLTGLALAAGYRDVEHWWNAFVETRQNRAEVFPAIAEAMTAARAEIPEDNQLNIIREAYMRETLRTAIQEKYQRIAVVCGAWHVPVLTDLENYQTDKHLLANLPQVEVDITWIPWAYSRLMMATGYGAGIQSPNWYHYLWETAQPQHIAAGWLTKVAHYLREQDLIASTAQVIDAVRLAETLATLRARTYPDLQDLTEATLSVLCNGNPAPLELISKDLIIGEKIGKVASSVPMVPLQRDFEALISKHNLELKTTAEMVDINLQLPTGRDLSRFLHRLKILELGWAQKTEQSQLAEIWELRWQPEMIIVLIEKAAWGITIFEAATTFANEKAQNTSHLGELTTLVHDILLADLPEAIPIALDCLQTQVALTGNILQLMQALPPLVEVMLYGDVRRSEIQSVVQVVEAMVVKIVVGLPTEAIGIDQAKADELLLALLQCNWAFQRLNNPEHLNTWYATLEKIMTAKHSHSLIQGRSCRIVFDANYISLDQTVRYMQHALNPHFDAAQSSAWLRGFLLKSGFILIHDDQLLKVIDEWMMDLAPEKFIEILPLLRRIFATFEYGEILNIGRKIQGKDKPTKRKSAPLQQINEETIQALDETLSTLLGLEAKSSDDPKE